MGHGARQTGKLIVLEGIDGAGTTTQLGRLAERIRAAGYQVHPTREPSDGAVGALIRQVLSGRVELASGRQDLGATLALLFAADRMDHVTREIEPALRAGKIVLSDRYVLSSLAYQGLSLPLRWVKALNARARPPDLTLFIEVSAKTAANRRSARGGAPELFERDELQRRIVRSYEKLLRGARRVRRLDGTEPPESVTEAALEAIRRVLELRV